MGILRILPSPPGEGRKHRISSYSLDSDLAVNTWRTGREAVDQQNIYCKRSYRHKIIMLQCNLKAPDAPFPGTAGGECRLQNALSTTSELCMRSR